MLLIKYQILSPIIVVFFVSCGAFSQQVIELGEAEVRGKREQPEAMTFIRRASLEGYNPVARWAPTEKIEKEIDGDIFSLDILK